MIEFPHMFMFANGQKFC